MRDLIFVFVSLSVAVVLADKTVWFDELPLEVVSQGWKSAAKNRSVEGNALSVGGKVRARGVGSHAPAVAEFDVGGKALSFEAEVGLDDEVLETNQDELGAQAARVAKGPRAEIWAKPMSDGSLVFALYNTYRRPTAVTVDFASLGLVGRWRVRDLWRQRDLGVFGDHYTAEVPVHATQLVRFFPEPGAGLAEGLKDVRDNSVYIQFQSGRSVDKPGYRAPTGFPCADCPRNRAVRKNLYENSVDTRTGNML